MARNGSGRFSRRLNMQRQIRRLQRGFTLIELMIVVAIIAILAAIALPQYQDYTRRSRAVEAFSVVSPFRTAITERFQTNGPSPMACSAGDCVTNLGLASFTATPSVLSVTVSTGGVITVVLSSRVTGDASATNSTFLLQPVNSLTNPAVVNLSTLAVGSTFFWRCGRAQVLTALDRVLPAECRQDTV
jgi:type IV pilus assembly protein PilA